MSEMPMIHPSSQNFVNRDSSHYDSFASKQEDTVSHFCWYLFWENPKNGRYYSAYLSKDFFNTWCLTLSWGGKIKSSGRRKTFVFNSLFEAILKVDLIKKNRLKRNYQLQRTNMKA